ncbi:MAG: hypothetical protein IJL93_03105 [Bacteroidales bacterium]|nr:hypothetical protein [Bacteroidales bacterium]
MTRKNLTRPLLLLLLILSLGSGCRKQDSAAEMEQSKPAPGSYYKTLELLNEKQKSIYRLAGTAEEENRGIRELNEERLMLACQYAPYNSEALKLVKNEAGKLSREQMMEVYNSLAPAMQKRQLGKAMKAYAKKEGVLVGDPLPHFGGVGVDGKPFDWSVTEGKRVLLIYEGWGYLKRSSHFWFKDLLAATDRDSLAVVAYVYAASMAELQKRVKAFQLEPYLVISDLQGKEGPLDRKMGIKGIPTYYYTDRQGRVRRVVAGFDPERFTMETGLSPQWGESWTGE